jgi:hypothetical protein
MVQYGLRCQSEGVNHLFAFKEGALHRKFSCLHYDQRSFEVTVDSSTLPVLLSIRREWDGLVLRTLLIPTSAVSLFLCSCGVYEREVTCKREAGPEPYQFADMLGPIGRMAAESTRERLEWDAKVAECKLHHGPGQKQERKPTKKPTQQKPPKPQQTY